MSQFARVSGVIDYVCRMAYEKTAKTKDTLCSGEHWCSAPIIQLWFLEEILGKPQSEIEAVDMLKKLSGATHEVITGIGFGHRSGDITVLAERTKVQFSRPIQVDEMVRYVGSGKPSTRLVVTASKIHWRTLS